LAAMANTKETSLQGFKSLKKTTEDEKRKLIEKYNTEKSLLEGQITTRLSELDKFTLNDIMTSQSSEYRELLKISKELETKKSEMEKKYIIDLQNKDNMILNCKRIIYLIEKDVDLPENYEKYDLAYAFTLNLAEKHPSFPGYKKLLEHKESWIEGFNEQQEEKE
jgi:hypothetical protein